MSSDDEGAKNSEPMLHHRSILQRPPRVTLRPLRMMATAIWTVRRVMPVMFRPSLREEALRSFMETTGAVRLERRIASDSRQQQKLLGRQLSLSSFIETLTPSFKRRSQHFGPVCQMNKCRL